MRLRIISDIHCDINTNDSFKYDFDDDFVIYCGDISGDRFKTGKWIKNNIKQGEDKDYEYRYAIIICAHNEENVIAQCIRSIHNMNYPKDKYKCFVVADNCTDKTIELAEKEGAIVIVKDDELPSTKGKALNYATRYISEKFYAQFDNICIIDSDNLVDKNFLKFSSLAESSSEVSSESNFINRLAIVSKQSNSSLSKLSQITSTFSFP